MSEEQLQEKALGLAKLSLNGKSELERAAVLHQHIGSRAMGDMVIETFEAAQGKDASAPGPEQSAFWRRSQQKCGFHRKSK